MSILVFGGSGFIGSRFIKCWSKNNSKEIVKIDILSYASDPLNLDFIKNNSDYTFYHEDINNKDAIREIIRKHKPNIFINFAAETHVDRSIDNSDIFLKSNINGVHSLLEAILASKKK